MAQGTEAVTSIERRNIETVAALEREALAQRTPGERFSRALARICGRTETLVFHAVLLALWFALNLGLFGARFVFDPFPFPLLASVFSAEAMVFSLVVLMAQDQLQKQADRRAHLDLQINLLNENETTRLLVLMTRIADRLGVDHSDLQGGKDLVRPTDPRTLVETIEKAMPDET